METVIFHALGDLAMSADSISMTADLYAGRLFLYIEIQLMITKLRMER
jgi:hypothetical protein